MLQITVLISFDYLCSIGLNVLSIGPTYLARGLINLLFLYCSRTCAVHPATLDMANKGVNKSVGMSNPYNSGAE